jgi:DNA-binding transcriptional MocR family regulator
MQEKRETMAGEVCFDGGCGVGQDEEFLDELEKQLLELSETEKRLRREGAMMVIEKLRTDEGGRIGSTGGGRLGSIGNASPPISPADAGESVMSKKLGGKTGPTVWSEFGALAASLKDRAINLGQGFPNWAPPDFVLEASMAAMSEGSHQYTRTAGHPSLITTLAARYSMHLERDINPESEVAITIGASQALFLSLQTLLSPGDEVILVEPFFDLYLGQIRLAGGTPVFVPLTPRDDGTWDLDMELLRQKINPKTRAIILNSPHNPSGKVFKRSEMEEMAQLVRENERITVISDEVYKYIVHTPTSVDGSETLGTEGHIHFAKLPGMWDRTITVSSAGKTFSVTGWQVSHSSFLLSPPSSFHLSIFHGALSLSL